MAWALRILANVVLFFGSGHCLLIGSSAKVNDKFPALTDLRSLFSDPAYGDMEAKLATLKQNLRNAQVQAIASVQQKKKEYDEALKEDLSRGDTLRDSNKHIKGNIDDLHQTNQKLREETQKLVIANKELSTHIELTVSNITLAQEFAVMSLKQGEMNFSSPELNILGELSERDKETQSNEELSRGLTAIENIGSRMSLYQFKSRQPGLDMRPLVQALSTSLEEIPKKQKACEENLTMQFNEKHSYLQAVISDLEQQQVSLNQALTSELAIQRRLSDARRFLSDTHTELVRRSVALKEFELKLGRNPSPGPRVDFRTVVSDTATQPTNGQSAPVFQPSNPLPVQQAVLEGFKGWTEWGHWCPSRYGNRISPEAELAQACNVDSNCKGIWWVSGWNAGMKCGDTQFERTVNTDQHCAQKHMQFVVTPSQAAAAVSVIAAPPTEGGSAPNSKASSALQVKRAALSNIAAPQAVELIAKAPGPLTAGRAVARRNHIRVHHRTSKERHGRLHQKGPKAAVSDIAAQPTKGRSTPNSKASNLLPVEKAALSDTAAQSAKLISKASIPLPDRKAALRRNHIKVQHRKSKGLHGRLQQKAS